MRQDRPRWLDALVVAFVVASCTPSSIIEGQSAIDNKLKTVVGCLPHTKDRAGYHPHPTAKALTEYYLSGYITTDQYFVAMQTQNKYYVNNALCVVELLEEQI